MVEQAAYAAGREHHAVVQRQAVAHKVGHAMEDLRRLIIVRQDDGVALALHR